MVIINYLGKTQTIDDKLIPENVSMTKPLKFESEENYSFKYVNPNNDYDVVEMDFLGAGIGWEIRGMFVPGDSRPYVLRYLSGPEKYRTKVHELVHKQFHNEGIPQSEYEVRRITSEITNFKDYYS